MLGDMVLEHIMQRAEFAEDGAKFCSLRANDVHTDAKETCYNWFCKVGTIRELLPRIYLELAIFPCWRFLIEQPAESLQRRVMMTRGVSRSFSTCLLLPVYFPSCTEVALFLLICWHDLFDAVVAGAGYLITCVNDIKLIFTRISSTKETAQGGFADSTRSLVSLMEPFVEFIMKSILNDASPELATDIVCFHAVDILHLIKCSNDNSYDQYLNYRLVGLRLSEQISQIATADTIVNEVIQVDHGFSISLSATLSQERLPYHADHPEVPKLNFCSMVSELHAAK
ncbi:hypothetical protein V6N13_085055 [Hibiscus sabdariffa]